MKFTALIAFFFLTVPATAQLSGLINYTQEDGLNAAYTYMIRQDDKGFIWIGSDNGLFRFDGTTFKQYNQKDGLKNIDVLEPMPMDNGDLLILPFLNDFALYRRGKITTAENNPELRKIRGAIHQMVNLKSVSGDTLAMMDNANPSAVFLYCNGKMTAIPVAIDYADWNKKSGDPDFATMSYTFDGKLYLWNAGDIYCYNVHTRKMSFVHGGFEKHPFAFSCFKPGLTGLFREKLFIIYDIRENKSTYCYFKKNIFRIQMNSDRIWVAFSDGGVAYFDMVSDPELKHPAFFMDEYVVNDAITDRDDNAWFSTKSNGIFFMDKHLFNSYLKLPVSNNNGYITAMAADSNSIFLGYNNGRAAVYRNKELKEFALGNGAQQYDVRSIIATGTQVLYGYMYMYIVNPLTEKSLVINSRSNTVKNMAFSKSGNILICGSNNLTEYNPATRQFRIILTGKTYSVLSYDKDSLFIGSFRDLYKYNTVTGKKIPFLSGYYFTDLKELRKNFYVGSTNGNGIYLFSNTGILQHISEQDGLAGNQVKRISIENPHTCWAATSSGLSRITLEDGRLQINTFTRADGLPSDRVADCIIRNDTVYAGTAKGMAILPVKDLLGGEKYIDKKVLINSAAFDSTVYFEPENISVRFPVRNITIDLSFPDYASAGKVSYEYEMEGLDKSRQISSSPKITFNSLPPGKYTFRVYGLSYNGKRSKDFSSFSFEIKPQFWQTGWFLALVILAACSVIILAASKIIQKRRDKKLKAAVYEKKIAELELQAIKAQVNPHFIYNCLNSIQFLLYRKDYQATENYLDVFAKMIRKTLHYSENTFIPISEEAEYLDLYLGMEKLRFKSNFDYAISVAQNVNPSWKIPSLLIQPFLENAVKHGISKMENDKGRITVAFEYSDPVLSVTITDNGSGIKDRALLKDIPGSFGIKLTQKRIDTFRQLFGTGITLEITDLSERGSHGTEIKLFLLLK